MKIVLVAQEAAGVHALRLVHNSGHRLVAVLTGTDHGEGAERGVTVAQVARELGIPVWPASLVKDRAFAAELRRDQVDLLLNVHSLYLIHAEALAAVRVGGFNLHPGPLPGYAGLNVPSWAIFRGERSHGVTLHWMAPRVDTGPVAYHVDFPVTPTDTGLSVSAACVRHGGALVSRLLADLSLDPGRVPTLAQDLTQRRYFGRAVPNDGWIEWERPAAEILNFVRACDYGPWPSPWGSPRTLLADVEISIGRASGTGEPTEAAPGTVGERDGDGVRIAAGDEWVVARRPKVGGAAAPHDLLRPGGVLRTPAAAVARATDKEV